jgi:hypothetical protein
MKGFPQQINVKNKHNFNSIFFDRFLCYLRKDIYEHLLKRNNDENIYFELDMWSRKYINNDTEIMLKMTNIIITELQEKGWKTDLSFGSSGLFIYSTEEKPPSCWPDN